MFEAIYKLVEEYPRIIIHRHKSPDGDALGAQQGLKLILKENYPEKEIFAVGDMTPRYAFMAEPPMDEIPDTAYQGALAILLDSSAKSLISDERFTLAAATARDIVTEHRNAEKLCLVKKLADTLNFLIGVNAVTVYKICADTECDCFKSLFSCVLADLLDLLIGVVDPIVLDEFDTVESHFGRLVDDTVDSEGVLFSIFAEAVCTNAEFHNFLLNYLVISTERPVAADS